MYLFARGFAIGFTIEEIGKHSSVPFWALVVTTFALILLVQTTVAMERIARV